jgi:hypothetical protein
MQVSNFDFGKNEKDEKVLVISILGILDALYEKKITIIESQKYLFSPYIAQKLISLNCKKEIVELVEKGCELEDVASLIPDKLDEIINKLREETLLQLDEIVKYEKEKWLVFIQ